MAISLLEIVLPILFLLLSAIAKKLGRGPGWVIEEDFSFGIELSIGTISTIFMEIIEVAKHVGKPGYNQSTLVTALINYSVFCVLMLVVFAVQIIILQEQKGSWNVYIKRWTLLGVSNLTGLALFTLFLLKIKIDLT
jgi:hypothetical protein